MNSLRGTGRKTHTFGVRASPAEVTVIGKAVATTVTGGISAETVNGVYVCHLPGCGKRVEFFPEDKTDPAYALWLKGDNCVHYLENSYCVGCGEEAEITCSDCVCCKIHHATECCYRDTQAKMKRRILNFLHDPSFAAPKTWDFNGGNARMEQQQRSQRLGPLRYTARRAGVMLFPKLVMGYGNTPHGNYYGTEQIRFSPGWTVAVERVINGNSGTEGKLTLYNSEKEVIRACQVEVSGTVGFFSYDTIRPGCLDHFAKTWASWERN